MSGTQPDLITSGGRRMAGSAVAVLIFIVDPAERFLLLAHPRRGGGWEVPNGALNAGETILEAVQREMREEAGRELQARPLGAVHAHTLHFDEQVTHLISISYLLAYESGAVDPGDDMAGSAWRWMGLEEIESGQLEILVPETRWIFRRALELHRLWKDAAPVELQPPLDASRKNKHERFP